MEDFPPVMNERTLAELLGVSPRTIRDWSAKGRLKAFRPTLRMKRFLRKDVVAFLKKWTA